MSDELDVLRHDRAVMEPDPQFRAELMERLRHEMASGSDIVLTALTPTDLTVDDVVTQTVSFGPRRPHLPRRQQPRRRWLVAAAVVLIAAAGVAVIQDRGDERGLDTVVPSIADLPRGETMDLPAGPLAPRRDPALVWSGEEMIVWGGADADDRSLGDGAAFDPATGTWRRIAPAPIEARSLPLTAWTGTEMLVVGGLQEVDDRNPIVSHLDGAAYNPETDTWRRVPTAPIGLTDARRPVWTGDELVVVVPRYVGDGLRAAAYDPETNEWRELAEVDGGSPGSIVWAGDALLMTVHGAGARRGTETDAPVSLLRYDPEADTWNSVSDESYAYLLAVPDSDGDADGDGDVRSVLAVPTEAGAPVTVLDSSGEIDGTLPGLPGARETFGDRIEPAVGGPGMWLGHEALFWMHSFDLPIRSLQQPAPWALDPETGTWRSLGTSAPPLFAHLELATDAEVLFGWGSLSQEEGAPSTGIAYRPPRSDDDLVVVEDRLGLPEPGDQPADPAAAEQQVRSAYLTLYDPSLSPEERAELAERPEVWLAAGQELAAGQYGEWVEGLYAEVDEVVFTSPTQAAVRFRLIAPDPRVPESFEDHTIGQAVLVDGRWLVATTTFCDLFSRGQVQCDLTL